MVTFRTLRFSAVYIGVPLLLSGLLGGGLSDLAFAQTTSTSSTTSLPTFNMSTPVQFSAQAIANIGSLFGSCMVGGVSSGLSGLSSTGSALPNSIADVASSVAGNAGGSCTGTDQVQQSMGGDMCEAATNGDGSFNDSVFTSMISQAQSVQKTDQCKVSAIQKLQSDINCMQTQANSLQQQIQSLTTSLQTNLTKQQTDVATIQGVITDRTQQEQQVNTRLTGDPSGSGTGGLLQAQTALNTELTTLSTAIPSQQQTVTSIAQQRALLTTQAQELTMSMTAQCFENTPNTNYHCTPNGPAMSAQAYVLCRVQQQAMVTSNGTINNNSITSQEASGVSSNLQTLLTNIFANAVTYQQPAADSAGQTQQTESTGTILTPNDIEVQYGALLSQFDGTNFPLHDTVMAAITSCYAQEQSSVLAQETRPGTQLYTAAQNITTLETQTKAAVDQELQDMTQAYTAAMAALTLQHVPLTTGQCTSATLANEMTCVTDLQANLQGLLQGNSSNSTVTVNIPSTDTGTGSSSITFQCQGINGCVTLYRQVSQNLGNEINRLGSEKTQYVTQANAQTDAFMNQIKTSLSGQSQMLQTKMQTLNSQLAMLGITPISMQTYTATPMTKDSTTGLYDMPTDLLATIGGSLVPPLLNVNGDSFTAGLSAIAQQLQQEESNEAQAQSTVSQLTAEEGSCKSKLMIQAQGSINTGAQTLITQCGNTNALCENNGGALNDLISSAVQAGLANGTSNVESTLQTGQAACSAQQTSQASLTQAATQIAKLGGTVDPNTGLVTCPSPPADPKTNPQLASNVNQCTQLQTQYASLRGSGATAVVSGGAAGQAQNANCNALASYLTKSISGYSTQWNSNSGSAE